MKATARKMETSGIHANQTPTVVKRHELRYTKDISKKSWVAMTLVSGFSIGMIQQSSARNQSVTQAGSSMDSFDITKYLPWELSIAFY